MEDLGWERNMSFPWINVTDHQHQQIEESFVFGSENMFLNPIQELWKTDSSICLNPERASGSRQTGHHHQPTPARLDSINVPSTFGAGSQCWSQAVAVNGFEKGKNVIPMAITATDTVTSLESLDCLLSATSSNAGTSADHEDGISVIFSDYKNLRNNNNIVLTNHNLSGVSSGDSVTKDIDDGIVSQCSSDKRLNKASTKRSSDAQYVFPENNDNPPKPKRPRYDPGRPTSSNINFRQETESEEPDSEAIAQMKEMIYRAAAFRPVSFVEEEVVEKPRRKNVRISSDPQTVAARQRRERISERIRVLQKLVPGGNKMDTASMLDEAANYLKFLRSQVKALEQLGQKLDYVNCGTTTNASSTSHSNIPNVTVGVPFTPNPFPMQAQFYLLP